MIPYEILIRGNVDGTLSGCHTIDTVGGDARPITSADLSNLAPEINAALFAECDALKASKEKELAAKDEALASVSEVCQQLESLRTEMVTKVSSVLQSGDPEQYAALAVEFLTPEEEKKKAAIRAQIAELEAQLA